MYNGYNFYFSDGSDVLTFPITPSELTIKVDSNNKVVTLIDEGDINILKSPSLTEVEFDARFPMRQYPYAREFSPFENYWNKFKELKEKKKSFRFIVARTTPNGSRTWDTNLLMALESMTINESADEGDDVIISFKLKQYKEYGVKKITLNTASTSTSTSSSARQTDGKGTTSTTYTVKSGDCLWNIAKAAYGDGSKYPAIYEANKTVIENEAKKHGRSSSSNGHWIYPGTQLVIPDTNTAIAEVEKLSGGTSGTKTSTTPSYDHDVDDLREEKFSMINQKYTLTINQAGPKEYGLGYTLYINNKEHIIFEHSNKSFTVKYGDKIKIYPIKVKGHTYIIDKSEFTIATNTTVSIKWVK